MRYYLHTYENRETEISFTHLETGKVIIVHVVQEQNLGIILSQKIYDVKPDGGMIDVKLSANVEFEVIMPEVDWITQVNTRGLQGHSISFYISDNGYECRSAEIVFASASSGLQESIIINQESKIKSVILEEAGTLKEMLGEDYLKINSLQVNGPLNGDDIYCLRKMLGSSDFSEVNRGKLTTLDLSQARIIEGGEWYKETYYTTNDEVGMYMFSGCSNLKKITLPETITTIRSNAFSNCTALKDVNFPDKLTEIGYRAFKNCDALSSIVIGENVTTICIEAFESCGSLSSITIGNCLTTIERDAFVGCSIESAYITNLSTWCQIDLTDEHSNPLNSGGTLYLNGDPLTSLIIPDEITEIKKYAFYGCDCIVNVTIGDNVTSLGSYAFEGCTSLKSLNINANLTSWGSSVFRNCVALSDVTLNENISTIGDVAFQNCSALNSFTFSENITTIGGYAFYNCDGLVSIDIPNNVKTLGRSAFAYCDGLTSVTIGDGLISIEYDTFHECLSLNSVTVGKRIHEILSGAFVLCHENLKFYCNASNPPIIKSDTRYYAFDFDGDYRNDYHRTLYVPERCFSAYQSSDWSRFFENIIEM